MRFIPACAGNTEDLLDILNSQAVHPRMCGEHKIEKLNRLMIDGSSPHVRGTRHCPDPALILP